MVEFGGFQTQLGHERFFNEFGRLARANKPIADKARKVIKQLIAGELNHPSFNTRKVQGNKDSRFRFVDITDKYRMVIAYEPHIIYFYSVGNHDETLKVGELASLSDHAHYSKVDSITVADRTHLAPEPVLLPELEIGATETLASLARDKEKVFDLFEGDVLSTLNGYEAGLLEDWMIFLAPAQHRAVERAQQGPYKVTGGPGTGKSVVALHAVKSKIKSNANAKILVSSFVNTVPNVLKNLTSRLVGTLNAERVTFKTVHKLALDITGWSPTQIVADGVRRDLLQQAIDSVKRKPNKDRDWLGTEISRVILARMVPDRETYLALRRFGRKVPVMSAERSLIWDVYQAYRAILKEKNLLDWDLLLYAAATKAQKSPPVTLYDTIIVDEAQDLTESGMRLLLALLEGGGKGNIVIIGDNKQRLYAGGYSLSDLGIAIKGRSTYLSLCYRTTEQIMRAVGALGQAISSDDFGEDGVGPTQLDYRLIGQQPEYHQFPDAESQWAWIISQLNPANVEEFDGTAILFSRTKSVIHAAGQLRQNGIGACDLSKYDGRPTPGVKIGTMKRAKSLEFYRVFIPSVGSTAGLEVLSGDEDEYLERISELYVAMSRARDRLILTGVGEPMYELRDTAKLLKLVKH
jgi:superfamily I DNA/RNA helicase